MKFSQYEQKIVEIINSAIPADHLVDIDSQDLDQIKGDILSHLIQNGGNISDSDVRAIVRVVQKRFPDF